MIARSWKARATAENAAAYVQFFDKLLAPDLKEFKGHRGALVLTRPLGASIEIAVVSFWDSMDAVLAFAGPQFERAVVEPEAQVLLESWDDSVLHYQVALDVGGFGPKP